MKLYLKLAWEGIRKNRKMTLPYWMTCSLCVAMFYILHTLSVSPAIRSMKGGTSTGLALGLGVIVMAVFSLIFLFYTHSFLIRRRKKEFGLYNVLGMDRRALSRILAWETVITAAVTLLVGLVCGIVFSRLSELLLAYMMGIAVPSGLTVSLSSVWLALVLFGAIFLLILLNAVRQIRFATATELIRSENVGEKPPRANWIPAVLGVILLAAAYWMAVTIRQPLTALMLFFVAVILVIIATYLLMISGSVTLCKALQKNRNYYYRAGHFVSVSSMAWRMKRNGAGLASICILGTMVLVMLSSTACLYCGAEDSLRSMYPREMTVQINLKPEEGVQDVPGLAESLILEEINRSGISTGNLLVNFETVLYGAWSDGEILLDPEEKYWNDVDTAGRIVQISIKELGKYNLAHGTDLTLAENEVLVGTLQTKVSGKTLKIAGREFDIAGKIEIDRLDNMGEMAFPTIVMIVPDYSSILRQFGQIRSEHGNYPVLNISCTVGFDTDASMEEKECFAGRLQDFFSERTEQNNGFHYSSYGIVIREEMKMEFYGTYSGFFFLGIVLSIVFLTATALMMYYKQISEGYEDAGRYGIMRKLGMTRKLIKQSIRSQMMTVFFFPLALAAVHLCFAFPMLRRLLMLFSIYNTGLLLTTAAISVAGFALFYIVVYRLTTKAYYDIVSE